MANRFTWALSAAIVLASARAASAQFTTSDVWSAAGVTGVVDEADRSMVQFNSTGSVSIKSSVTSGTLDLRYQVHTMPSHEVANQSDCTEMRAVLRDTGAGARVILRLMRLDIRDRTGQLTSLGGIDSNTSVRWNRLGEPTAYALYSACLNVPDTGQPFDFAFYTYYVDAQLIKSTSTANPGSMAVQICHTNEHCEP